jgi:hypothetical protein
MAGVLRVGDLRDHGVILEYQLPQTSRRLDFLLCGRDSAGTANAAIIELKQWSRSRGSDGERLVSTILGGAWVETLHPSAQALQYSRYLTDNHTAFYEGPQPIQLRACSFLHNYEPEDHDALHEPRFADLIRKCPVFCQDDVPDLSHFLRRGLTGGDGEEVMRRIEQGKYRPSRKLLEHVKQVIRREPAYTLLDEQAVVYDKVRSLARRGLTDGRKSVVVVKGGPGTGKSVIAMNLIADLAGQGLNAQYATGSRAFTETLRRLVGARAQAQFRYFNSYMDAEQNAVDVLVCDEAHRIRETSANRFTPRRLRSKKPQIEELIGAAKTCVFFIDDHQGVRDNEIGTSEYILAEARRLGTTVYQHELEAQFRCAGSDGFVNWVNNTLGIAKTANVLWTGDPNFEFEILKSPEELEKRIRSKGTDGYSARITAGFCWPWSDPLSDGTLVGDVSIGQYIRPWNAKSDAKKRLAQDIPKETLWAHDPRGIDQIGCVYTAQGFEFDYVGVIFGTDLMYDQRVGSWTAHRENSADPSVLRSKGDYGSLIKHTYRILLSRGMKGCFVYFLDKPTEQFFRSRIEVDAEVGLVPAPPIRRPQLPEMAEPELPFTVLPRRQVRPFQNSIPLLELEAAAGLFGRDQSSRPLEVESVETWVISDAIGPKPGMFVARVVGESMNRRIPNGAWCVFRANPTGSRSGRVVLAALQDAVDPEGRRYSVKVYYSERRTQPDGTWEHTKVVLRPDSSDKSFEPLTFEGESLRDLRIVAELVSVLA